MAAIAKDTILWWIIGALFVGLTSISGIVYSSLSTRVDQSVQTVGIIKEAQQVYRERIVALEAQALANRDNIMSIKSDIVYIRNRLDELMSRKP